MNAIATPEFSCPAPEAMEIPAEVARSLIDLRLATLLDIRQPFEIEIKGVAAGAIEIPFFHLKHQLGNALTAEEQELLDADAPREGDLTTFLRLINRSAQSLCATRILLCLCNSGRRSLLAAETLRSLGYPFTFSIENGIRNWEIADQHPD